MLIDFQCPILGLFYLSVHAPEPTVASARARLIQFAAPVVQDVLEQKCAYKRISIPVLADIEGYRGDLERNWEPMLAHQLPFLPAMVFV